MTEPCQGYMVERDFSKTVILSFFWSVSPMSSRPSTRAQYDKVRGTT
jgi:hypothetical protein